MMKKDEKGGKGIEEGEILKEKDEIPVSKNKGDRAKKGDKSLTKGENKKGVITDFSAHKKDTGSAPVQIALLTNRINYLSDHLKTHKKDKHSRRGLLGMVGRRRKLLRYLKGKSSQMYATVTKKLGLRK